MKKRMVSLFAGVVIVILVVILAASTVFRTAKSVPMENTGFKNYNYNHSGIKLTADFNEKTGEIILTSPKYGEVWRSAVAEERRLQLTDNKLWHDYMASLIVVNYTDSRQNKFEVKKIYSASENCTVDAVKSEQGINYTFTFDLFDIEITVEIVFEDDLLVLRIPADKIREGERYLLTAIEIMPFFGAADHTTDGYIFYPDGCGALMCYENYSDHAQASQTYTMQIYGAPQFQENGQIAGGCMLPIYGVKNDKSAFLAAVTAGEADCNINISAEGTVLDLNRAAFTMNYRYSYTVPGSDIVSNTANNGSTYADKDMLKQDFESVFFFLEDESADYSGMANIYRDFLLKNGLLNSTADLSESAAVSIGFATGVAEEQMLFSKKIAATSFAQVGDFITTLSDGGFNDFDVTLLGWEKGGIGINYPGYAPWSILGGKSGLKKLCDEIESKNIRFTLAENIVSVASSDKGYSVRNDIVYAGNNMVLTDDDKTQFVLNSAAFKARLRKFAEKKPEYASVLLEDIGSFLSADYSSTAAMSRSQTAEAVKEMLADYSENGKIEAEGGNLYLLSYAQRLADIPDKSSRLFITDAEIPFYQMLIHGSVTYTGEAYNLAYDEERQFLKMLEYGYQPYFLLTQVSPDTLKYTACNELFSCEFDVWKDSVTEMGSRMQKTAMLKDQYMIRHQSFADGSAVTYSNGYVLYINTSDEDTEMGGYSVKAKDFLLVDEKGAIG